jgi:hypothetical protein
VAKENGIVDDLGANGPGSVYVFNVNSEDMSLGINGVSTSGGTIPAWSRSGGNQYQPASQAVPRTLNASDGPGKFFNGRNALAISWPDGLYGAQVQIDGGQFPLNLDLILFVTRNSWQLVNQYAVQVASGQVTPYGMGGMESVAES